MRRPFMLIALSALLVSGATTSLAATTEKLTIQAKVAQASWENVDPDTYEGEVGYLSVYIEDGVTSATFQRSIGEVVLCDDAGTPDPDDDYYGFVGSDSYGEGPAKLTFGRQYTSALATATLTVDTVSYDECSGDIGSSSTSKVKIALDLTAISRLVKETNRSSITIPGELRAHTLIRATSRLAAGTLKVGSVSSEVGGVIGVIRLRGHATIR